MRYARTDPRRASLCFLALIWFMCCLSPVQAQTDAARRTAPEGAAPAAPAGTAEAPVASGDAVILELRVNEVAGGEILALVDSQADPATLQAIWVDAAGFDALGVDLGALEDSSLDGQDYVLLRASEQVGLSLDLDTLRLSLRFAPELLPQQTIDLSTGADVPPSAMLPMHAWLDYDLAARGDERQWAVGANLAANLALGEWSLRSEHVVVAGDEGGSAVHVRSVAERDWPTQMVRVSFGDLSPASLPFGRVGAISGIRVARRFDLRPGFASPPPFSYSGTAETPSTAEIYLDGALLRSVPIAPGQFEMQDLSYFAGLRDVRIVIADAFGGRQEILLPHYFSEDPLRRGLHEFDYALGAPRGGQGAAGSSDDLAFTGWHRYGVNDFLTVGAGLEATRTYDAWSLDASWVPGRAGTFRAHYSQSTRKLESADVGGSALMLGYAYSAGAMSFSLNDWRQDAGFGRGVDEALVPIAGAAPKRRTSADLSFAMPLQQSVGLSLARDQRHAGPDTDQMGLRYSVRLAGAMSLTARYARSRSEGRYANEAAIGLQFDLGQGWSGGAGIEQGSSRARRVLAVDRGRPDAGGWGGRAALEDGDGSTRLDAGAVRDFEAGAFNAALTHRQGGASSSGTAAAVQFSGALTLAGGKLRASRPVREAFALVDTGGLAGVRVYRNNTLAGTTGSDGRLLLPGLGAYTRNQIRLDDRDIPMDVELEAITLDAVPRSRIGADVRFRAQRIISAGGRLQFAAAQGAVMVTAAELRTTVDGQPVVTSTGPDGDFYIDGLVPGEFVLEARNASISCRALMRVADDAPAFTDLGVVDCVPAP